MKFHSYNPSSFLVIDIFMVGGTIRPPPRPLGLKSKLIRKRIEFRVF